MAKPEEIAVFLDRDEAQQIVIALDVHAAMTSDEDYQKWARQAAEKVRRAAEAQGWDIEPEVYDA